jgi:hypothetical protein
MGASGFMKLLGRPQMDPLTVLVRETAQNSWDARASDEETVGFSIRGEVLTEDGRTALQTDVFVDSHRVKGSNLAHVLKQQTLTALFISDRNTKGLGGPLLASVSDDSGVYDWVDFVLNIGKATSNQHSGGTYGFGKTIAYVISSAHSIVVYSKALYQGKVVSRLLGCAIGDQFDENGTLFTGRHWWGLEHDGSPRPIEGSTADELAARLGVDVPSGDDLGTTLMVIAPDFGERTPLQGMTFLSEAVIWNLWPKLVDRAGYIPMDVKVSWCGKTIPLPEPADRPPLLGFVQAFRGLVVDESDDELPGYESQLIARQRPHLQIGDLATVPMVVQPRAIVDDGHDPEDRDSPLPASPPFSAGCHHVALLRTPEMVVNYLEGPASPAGSMEWAGVFRARDDLDDAFAQAEPPTHDAWRPELVEDRADRLVVRKALQEIRTSLQHRWGERVATDSAQHAPSSTAAVAERLSHLVGASSGAGSGRPSAGPSSGARVSRGISVNITATGLIAEGEDMTTWAEFEVNAPSNQRTHVVIRAGLALDGSQMDASEGSGVELRRLTIGESETVLAGSVHEFGLIGSEVHVGRVVATRTSQSSVIFDIRAEVAPTTDGSQR